MTEHALSVTLKAGTGYDAPWVVVYGDHPSDVEMKLDGITGVLQKATSAAAAFRTLQTLEGNGVAVQSAHVEQPAQQSAPPQQQWQSSPPDAAPSWAAQPQQAAPQQGGSAGGPGNRPGAQLHPEGKTCDICPNVLEFKKTTTGKPKWQCPEWRWGNGNPNGHGSEWIN